MAPIKIIITSMLITNIAVSQNDNNQIDKKKDTIVFHYKKSAYNKIAKDSMEVLYQKQFNRYSKGGLMPYIQESAISLNYKLKDLTYFSIPKFRLYEVASKKFDCNSNIENFIAFEEYNKYQFVLIRHKKEILNKLPVPNPIFERQRITNPGPGNTVDSYTYNIDYIQPFSANPKFFTVACDEIINNKNNNFFFEIYGMYQVLFEIDVKTGLLYSNYYGDIFDYGTQRRMLANEYIRKYFGIKLIKAIASGNYNEIDKEEWELPVPCENFISTIPKVFLKVIRD